MSLEPIELADINELYAFVESCAPRTAVILDHEAIYRPWARSVSSACSDIRWLYPARPFPEEAIRHFGNFAHTAITEKAFVLIEKGRVVKAIDVNAVGGSSEPHRLANVVRNAFEPKQRAAAAGMGRGFSAGDPYAVLGVAESDSDETIRKRYKQLVMEYHPDRVAHLGQELKDLAGRKTTEINAAYAVIRRDRKL
jgi:hypothetical protein